MFFSNAAATRDGWRLSRPFRRDGVEVDRHTLLQVFAIASAGNFPIQPLIAALAEEHSGSQRRRLLKISALIRSGTPAIAAFEQVPGCLSDEQLLSLRFASQSGQFPATLEWMVDKQRAANEVPESDEQSNSIYWGTVALITVFMWALMMTFIWPTFQKMWSEFEIELSIFPVSIMAAAWRACVDYWPICLLMLSLGVVLMFSQHAQRFLLAKFTRFTRARAEGVHPVTYELLASTIEAGKPLLSGMSTLGKYHFDPDSRQKMLVARNEIEQGASELDGMHQAQVVKSDDIEALKQFPTADGKAYVLRSIAERERLRDRTQSYRRQIFLEPFMILLLGIPVLWICVSFFYLLTQLVSLLA